jgi:cytochrome c peroxidase
MLERSWASALLGVALLAAFAVGEAKGLFDARPPDRWSAEERAVLASLHLDRLPPAPADASNAVESLPAAVDLGRRLFNDPRFSRNGAVSCASCHDAARQFQDGRPLGQGIGTGARRTMPIVGLEHGPWFFWDGRKDSAWSQALGPLEDAAEHGGNRLQYARLMREHYRADYEALFRAMPNLDGLPRDAGPNGSAAERAAWDAIGARRRDEVSRVFADMGKAIAAYEKSLRHEPSRLDRYLEGVETRDASALAALQPNEVRGLRLFIGKAQCIGCHNGPLLTDQAFHNTGVPPRDPARPDAGRLAALAKLRADEFNCLGRFSDAKPEQCQELRFMVGDDDPSLAGAFKTPGLRGVAARPPYMHAGQIASLEAVVRHYVQAPPAALGHSELLRRGERDAHAERRPIELSEAEIGDLVSFLGTLSKAP